MTYFILIIFKKQRTYVITYIMKKLLSRHRSFTKLRLCNSSIYQIAKNLRLIRKHVIYAIKRKPFKHNTIYRIVI